MFLPTVQTRSTIIYGTIYSNLQMKKLKFFQLKWFTYSTQLALGRIRIIIQISMAQKTHLFFLHMDLLSGSWAICTLSHLGANRGKRVKHLEPMKFRDCTKGKYQSSGNQQKKNKTSVLGRPHSYQRLQWEETGQKLLPLREPFENFSGNPWPSPAFLNSKDGEKKLCDQVQFS